jgi:ribonuclease P protein subunit POP4
MKIDRQNVVNHELIGLRATIVGSTNRDSVGISGRVVDETRNIFVLESGGREKKAAKHGNTFEFELPESGKVTIDGDILVGRPEDRVAKRQLKWHPR